MADEETTTPDPNAGWEKDPSVTLVDVPPTAARMTNVQLIVFWDNGQPPTTQLVPVPEGFELALVTCKGTMGVERRDNGQGGSDMRSSGEWDYDVTISMRKKVVTPTEPAPDGGEEG